MKMIKRIVDGQIWGKVYDIVHKGDSAFKTTITDNIHERLMGGSWELMDRGIKEIIIMRLADDD